jgi:uncharacterized DUF497 family protein
MEFEWSEAERLAVLSARRLDFVDGQALFDGRHLLTDASPRDDEARWVSVGEFDGRLVAIVWTKRDHTIRIIAMRRTRRVEERRDRALYG